MSTLRRVCTGNVALVGDASGGVDAITGDGLRLAFQHALALAEAIESRNLREYEMAHKRLAQRPRQMGRVLLLLGRNATIRERALQALGARPQLFERFLAIHLKNGAVHFDPDSGKAGGEIVVFATSGDSGNSSRDEKMHKEVLESAKYPDVVFHPTQVEGKVARTGNSDVKLRGTFVIHGAEHELIVPVQAELVAEQWKGTAKFEVPFIKWGLKDPSNWLLKVKPIVQVEVEMAGTSKAGN